MGQRLDLQKKLESLLGSKNVYFQPPAKAVMQYPCIVYQLDGAEKRNADNEVHFYQRRYQLTYITRNPDDILVDQLATMPMTSFESFMAAEGLNQYVYSTYF